MPLAPNALERLLLLRLNKAPGPVLDLVGGAGERAVGLALDLDLFDALAAGPVGPPELARRLDADPAGVEVLLDFLAALGYVTADDGAYRNTRMTEAWLLESGTDVGPWLRFWSEVVFPFWERELERAVRDGDPSQTLYEWLDEHTDRWPLAHEGFRATARVLAPTVVEKVAVDAADRVLDVGGGHGLYAAEIAARHDCEVTVVDAESARETAEATFAEYGVGDRATFVAGDYESDDLGEVAGGPPDDAASYDAALLFNVVHAHDGPENVALFERIQEALVPGGRLFVLDQLAGTGRTTMARATVGFVGLTYLVTLGQRAHDAADVSKWLEAAGFDDADRRSFLTAPGVSLLSARRSG